MRGPFRLGYGALLGLFLTACSFAVTVDLPEQSFSVAALPNTQGKILYPKKTTFNPPPVSPKSVSVQGTLEASQTLNTTLNFYVRLKDPATDPGCTDLSSYGIQAYACGIGPDDEKAGEARFQWSPSAPLTLQGENLTQGIAQGGFWLGLEVQGLPSGPVNFTLKNPKALVTVGL
ncbi:MAG: hypothetical protein ACK4ZX_06430 [Thermus sp.]